MDRDQGARPMKQMQLQDQVPQRGPTPLVTDSRRVPLERKVILKFHHFGGFFIEYSANVSLTGMFIKTDSPKPAGSVFIFEIWLGEEHKLVHGLGEVVWVRPEDERADRPAGMGIRFLKIDDNSRSVVRRVITEHVEKGGRIFDLDEARPRTDPGPAIEAADAPAPDLGLVDRPEPPRSPDDLLVLDEDLLGFDGPTAAPAAPESVPHPAEPEFEGQGRGLRVALLLAFLGAVLGGAAYLVSADLLPF